jgi:hypothetical protein
MMARWSASIARFMCNAGRKLAGKPARPPRSSTARASKARKKVWRAIDPSGYDAGKSPQRGALSAEIKGKKRHLLVDTQGLLMGVIVHAADIQDRDGGILLMSTRHHRKPCIDGLADAERAVCAGDRSSLKSLRLSSRPWHLFRAPGAAHAAPGADLSDVTLGYSP